MPAQWKSDMLWGAAGIALADEAVHARPAWVRADLRPGPVVTAAPVRTGW